MKVLVIASGDKIREAQEAGADFVGGDDMVKDPGRKLDRLRRRDCTPI
jgi:ribosomal protein L1